MDAVDEMDGRQGAGQVKVAEPVAVEPEVTLVQVGRRDVHGRVRVGVKAGGESQAGSPHHNRAEEDRIPWPEVEGGGEESQISDLKFQSGEAAESGASDGSDRSDGEADEHRPTRTDTDKNAGPEPAPQPVVVAALRMDAEYGANEVALAETERAVMKGLDLWSRVKAANLSELEIKCLDAEDRAVLRVMHNRQAFVASRFVEGSKCTPRTVRDALNAIERGGGWTDRKAVRRVVSLARRGMVRMLHANVREVWLRTPIELTQRGELAAEVLLMGRRQGVAKVVRKRV